MEFYTEMPVVSETDVGLEEVPVTCLSNLTFMKIDGRIRVFVGMDYRR